MTRARSTSLREMVLRRLEPAPETATSLVVANLLPLAGVLFLGWSLGDLLVLYWLESGIIGLINVPKLMLAQGPLRVEQGGMTVTLPLPGGLRAAAARLFGATFFVVHYGIFWLGHGLMVLLLAAMGRQGARGAIPIDATDPLASAGIDAGSIATTALVLLVSHLLSFWRNFLGRREYLTTSPIEQMTAPYARVVIMHLTILGGALVVELFGTPIGALVILAVLKTGLDLRAHLRERTVARQRAASARG